METERVFLDRNKARELYRAYKTHRHYDKPMDDEIRRAYQLLAQGRLVIQAIASIKAAGVNDDGQPKLAIARADEEGELCYVRINSHGGGHMSTATQWWPRQNCRRTVRFPNDTFPPGTKFRTTAAAIVPVIPAHFRPKRGLANYHILWEAEWQKLPPHDPYLLRRIGKADLWLVVAMWDLTEVERAVLAGRIGTA